MCFLSPAKTEGSHANLRVGSVVEDLELDLLRGDELAHVRLHQQVSSLIELVVKSQVIDLVEDSLHLHPGVAADLDLLH